MVELADKKVTLRELKEMSRELDDERVGATVDPKRRAGEYTRKGYRGVMYYAETQNMKQAEGSLLASCQGAGACPANVQQKSNVQEKPGYVYVIVD